MNRYRRGIWTIRGMTRESGRLLREHNRYPTTPQQPSPRRSGIVRSPTKKSGLSAYAPGKVVFVIGFAAMMKRGKNGNAEAGNDAAGEAGGRQS